MSTRTGISFLTGIAKSDGGSILKSDECRRNGSRYPGLRPLRHYLK